MASVNVSQHDNIGAIIELLGVDPEQAVIDGNLLSVPAEQAALDAAMATYNADLEAYQLNPMRVERERFISERIAKLVESRYPAYRLQMFNALYTHAVRHNLSNRADYIEQLLNWVSTATSVALLAKTALNGASTVDGIMVVDVNLETLAASDPLITLEAAVEIAD